ncbi:trehalose 6-phosphate synthase [Oceanidesulfovibrio indonesiensis]|uniref:Trehalose 6-phosphate synthase n=1 Tax=Oceanidesulfovibrio indonesiensis TaxID=54767 RepID=A0A7M3MEV2_9BACT|nr:trehalose 6-phosphate synthase [Oceanidesulfovibrio indonesiensis]TVM17426.1 trehalose 6-phosphate synthase [Oceanidesulfovibrio indonesiensis]
MERLPIEKQTIYTLLEFYELMAKTREVKKAMAEDIFAGRPGMENGRQDLKNALDTLLEIPRDGADPAGLRQILTLDGKAVAVDLVYEKTELLKDLQFIDHDEPAFVEFLGTIHPDFEKHVNQGVELLQGKRFRAFITDRDGTVNNYCGRYRSSIQSLYNAVFLARFAKNACEYPILLTSAPLASPGVVDVSVMPTGAMILAASKGREYLGLDGRRHAYHIEEEKQAVLDAFNERIASLLQEPEKSKFTLIGSGLQFKFGQTTIARQDISRSISEEESLALLREIEDLVGFIDPDGQHLRIEDTGLDVEVILTFETAEGTLKDFDKGDSVRYLDATLGIQMDKGPHLVCGDTLSDLPMLETAMQKNPDETYGVFVTKNPELDARVREICPRSVVVPQPDMLVTMLGRLA